MQRQIGFSLLGPMWEMWQGLRQGRVVGEQQNITGVFFASHLRAGRSTPLEPRRPFQCFGNFFFCSSRRAVVAEPHQRRSFPVRVAPCRPSPNPLLPQPPPHPPAGIPASCASACHTTGFGMERLRALCRRARGRTLTNPLCPAWEW